MFGFALLAFALFAGIGHDGVVRMSWHAQFNNQFWNGVWYPHWLPESFAGFGSPAFYFYPPLVFWIGAVFNPLNVFSAEYSNAVVAVIGSLLSAMTMSYYLKRYTSDRKIVLLASGLYAIHPYRVFDVIVRGALSEHFAFVFLPLIFLSIDLALKGGKKSSIFSLSLAGWTGLILTNIPMVVIAFIGSIVYSLWRFQRLQTASYIFFVCGGIAALFITAFYTLPILELKSAVMLDRVSHVTLAAYILADLFTYNYKFALTLLFILVLTVAVPVSIWRKRAHLKDSREMLLWEKMLIVIALVTFIQIPYIQAALNMIPLMNLVQFSWRWMALAVPLTSAGLLLLYMIKDTSRTRWLLLAYGALNLAIIGSSVFLYYLVRPLRTEETVWFEEPEYMNNFVHEDPDSAYNAFRAHKNDPFILAEPTEDIQMMHSGINTYIIESSLPKAVNVTFHQQYFPLWNLAEDNRKPIPLYADTIGRMTTKLETGKHSYTLSLLPPESAEIAAVVSIIGALGSTLLIIALRRKKNR